MKATILDIIRNHGPIKRKNLRNMAIAEAFISPRSHGSNGDLTERRMRLLVVELIRDGNPIASSEKGYSIIQNVRELTEAVNYLKAKARSLSIRANTLMGNFSRTYQRSTPANLQFKLF